MYLNKAIIIGNLTRDPEVKSLPNGTAVVNFAVATNRVWKDRDGKKQEATEYHNVVVFGPQAESSGRYLKKGQSVLVEGRLQTRSWDDKNNGEKKYRTEIIADTVQFGPKAGGVPAAGPDMTGNQDHSSASTPTKPAELKTIEYPEEDINPEDIPF